MRNTKKGWTINLFSSHYISLVWKCYFYPFAYKFCLSLLVCFFCCRFPDYWLSSPICRYSLVQKVLIKSCTIFYVEIVISLSFLVSWGFNLIKCAVAKIIQNGSHPLCCSVTVCVTEHYFLILYNTYEWTTY